ncbi:MAG: hypothetical protein WC505_07145 [Patescibacteria group bacterium]
MRDKRGYVRLTGKKKGVKISTWLENETYRKILLIAKSTGKSSSAVVREHLEEAVLKQIV